MTAAAGSVIRAVDGATGRIKHLTGDDAHEPDSPYPVPPPDLFEQNDSRFIAAPDLSVIAAALRKADPDHFHHLASFEIAFLWKASGGGSRGKTTLGRTSKPSGLLHYFADADFVIWLAPDHLRDFQHPDRFGSEVERYGAHMPSLERVAESFKQMPLWEVGAPPPSEPASAGRLSDTGSQKASEDGGHGRS